MVLFYYWSIVFILKYFSNFYFRYEVQMGSNQSRFKGVTLQELDTLEKLYEVNIMVYSLEMGDEQEEENPQPFATLVRRSHHHYPTTMNLNLYKDHFSYIKNFARYSKSYKCTRCGKLSKVAAMCQRHEQTFACDSMVVPTVLHKLCLSNLMMKEYKYPNIWGITSSSPLVTLSVCSTKRVYRRTPKNYPGKTDMNHWA